LKLASHVSLQAIAWAVLVVYVFRVVWLTSKILTVIELSWDALFVATRGGLILGIVTAGTLYLLNMGLAAEGVVAGHRLLVLGGGGLITVVTLSICIRQAIYSTELRAVLERSLPERPRLLRTVMLFTRS